MGFFKYFIIYQAVSFSPETKLRKLNIFPTLLTNTSFHGTTWKYYDYGPRKACPIWLKASVVRMHRERER
jgi:hypothetical protein